jgi:hypothetical protein
MPVQRVVGGVEIEDDLLWRAGTGVQEQIDELRHDPMIAVLAGKLTARRNNCAPVAGKSTLNRFELGGAALSPYHKIGHDPAAIEGVFVPL